MLIWESLGFKSLEEGLKEMDKELSYMLENGDILIGELGGTTFMYGESAVATLDAYQEDLGICNSFGEIYINTSAIVKCAKSVNIDPKLLLAFVVKHEEGHLIHDHSNGISYKEFLTKEEGYFHYNTDDTYRREVRADGHAVKVLDLDYETFRKCRLAINNYNKETGTSGFNSNPIFDKMINEAFNYFKEGEAA